MRTPPRRIRLLRRLALIAMVGVIAVVLLSSSLLAGVVGLVTVVAVLFDMSVCAPSTAAGVAEPDGGHTPARITVDLRRRS